MLPAAELVTFEVETSRERVHGAFNHPGFASARRGRTRSRAVLQTILSIALFVLPDGEFGEGWLGGIDVDRVFAEHVGELVLDRVQLLGVGVRRQAVWVLVEIATSSAICPVRSK